MGLQDDPEWRVKRREDIEWWSVRGGRAGSCGSVESRAEALEVVAAESSRIGVPRDAVVVVDDGTGGEHRMTVQQVLNTHSA